MSESVQADKPVAAVLGGSSGIGAGIARRLDRDGYRVVVAGRRHESEAGEILGELTEADYVQADMTDQAAADAVVATVMNLHGRLDVVVYAAGTTVRIPHPDLDSATDEVWDRILDVNLLAPWRIIRAAAPALRRSKDGAFVVVGALAGSDVGGSSIPYAVSKAAVHHMCKLLGGALGPEIRVNAVAPGFIDTPWTDGWDELRNKVVAAAPLARTGTPDDVADLVSGLIASKYVTGQTVVVDGGFSLIP